MGEFDDRWITAENEEVIAGFQKFAEGREPIKGGAKVMDGLVGTCHIEIGAGLWGLIVPPSKDEAELRESVSTALALLSDSMLRYLYAAMGHGAFGENLTELRNTIELGAKKMASQVVEDLPSEMRSDVLDQVARMSEMDDR